MVMTMNNLVYAYLGDAVYELYIREFLIKNKILKVNDLQKSATKYVSAKAQATILNDLVNEKYLKDNENEIIRKARNTKIKHHPKNADIITYKMATAFEALLGYLYLNGDKSRLEEIITWIEKRYKC